MNGRIAKKIRKHTRHNFLEYVNAVREWPFLARWRLCWYILFSRKEKQKKLNKARVLKERRAI